MRQFAFALALVATAQPGLARESSRQQVRVVPAVFPHAPTYATDERWSGALLAVPYAREMRRRHGGKIRARRDRTAVLPELYARHDFPPTAQGFGSESIAARQPMQGALAAMAARHAQANGLPESLVHRVIMRESRYNPRAVSRGNYGLMQIRLGTARAMGYGGPASGLLDPETNMTYAVRYLAGAYRAAGGNPNRAVANYTRGYYAQARRHGFSPYAAAHPGDAFTQWRPGPGPANMF